MSHKFQTKINFRKQWLVVFPIQNILCKILTAASWFKHPSRLLSCSMSAFRQQLQSTHRISCSRAAPPCLMFWAGFQISLMSRLTGLLTEDQISPGSRAWKPQEYCCGQTTWWHCPGRKAGHQLEDCTGTAGSQMCGKRQGCPRALPRCRWGSGLAGSPLNHPSYVMSSLEAPSAWFGHTCLTTGWFSLHL